MIGLLHHYAFHYQGFVFLVHENKHLFSSARIKMPLCGSEIFHSIRKSKFYCFCHDVRHRAQASWHHPRSHLGLMLFLKLHHSCLDHWRVPTFIISLLDNVLSVTAVLWDVRKKALTIDRKWEISWTPVNIFIVALVYKYKTQTLRKLLKSKIFECPLEFLTDQT